jgi:hypothetical protein
MTQYDKIDGQQQPLQCESSPEKNIFLIRKWPLNPVDEKKLPIVKLLLTSTTTWPANRVLLAKMLLLPILQS